MADRESTARDFTDLGKSAQDVGEPLAAAIYMLTAVIIRSTDQICDAIHDARPDSGF